MHHKMIFGSMIFKVIFFFGHSNAICNCVDDSNITTSFMSNDGKWCCRYGKEDCMIDKYDYGYGVKSVTCSGKTIPLSEQCHDGDDTTPVCNYIHSTPNRNYVDIDDSMPSSLVKRSYLDVCKDNM